MKDSIICIDPKTGRVVCLTENTQIERELCAAKGLDIISVQANYVCHLFTKTVEIEIIEVDEDE